MKKQALVFACSSLLLACSSSSDQTPTSVVADQLPFPAFAPDVPQVVNLGGPVMDSPRAVAITFANDALADDLEKFVSGIGATAYWAATTSEYGVAPLVALPPIRLTETAPAAITDDEIGLWLKAKLDGSHPEFPPPGVNTVYTLFYPSSTVISQGGSTSCQAFGGYHNSSYLEDGTPVVYAVLPRCAGLKDVTLGASHELIEAATDPQPIENPAYLQVDDRHAIWTRLTGGGGETGDMCAQNQDAAFVPDGFPYTVQRSWSNLAAAGGLDPCVPSASDSIYFNAAPRSQQDDITLTGFGTEIDSAGWAIAVGDSRTIIFEIYSDAPTASPIDLTAIDLSAQRQNKPPTLSFSFDRSSGYNGDRVHLTVKALQASSSRSGVTSFEVRASSDGVTRTWIGLVKAQ